MASIVATSEGTISLSNNGDMYSWGMQTYGELAHEPSMLDTPTKVTTVSNIVAFACGSNHTVCLDADGNIFTCGDGRFGQLGFVVIDNPFYCTNTLQKVKIPTIKQVSCGLNFTVCLADNGDLYSFGCNDCGQLGLGNTENYFSPKKIETITDIQFVECGSTFSFCKSNNNEIFCWGSNSKSQLGIGNTINQHLPYKCIDYPDNVVNIKCGDNHTLVLTSNQEVFSCGINTEGQLGRFVDFRSLSSLGKISTLQEIIRIECGANHSICIDIHDNLYVFGDNNYGQIGLGFKKKSATPVKHDLSNVIDVSRGGCHTFVKTSNNEIYAFGRSDFGCLGEERSESRQVLPIRVLKGKEDIWCSTIKKQAKSARK